MGYDAKGRRKRGDNEPIHVLCEVCKGKHEICTKCVRNSPNVFWDKPGGPMKVKWCATSMSVLDAIEGPMRTTEVCEECGTEPKATVSGLEKPAFCEKCKKRVKVVVKKVPAQPGYPGIADGL